MRLLEKAKSKLVRVWTIQLLKREHKDLLAMFPPKRVIALFDHEDEQVQQFAADMLGRLRCLDQIDAATWLSMLQVKNPAALGIVCELIVKHVRPEQLTADQAVELATARAIPVARLGLRMLREKPFDNAAIGRLAQSRCEAVGR